jgi:hypothetical protein
LLARGAAGGAVGAAGRIPPGRAAADFDAVLRATPQDEVAKRLRDLVSDVK